MMRPKHLAKAFLATALLAAFTGCRTTVVQPVEQRDVPVDHHDDHHDDHPDDHHPPDHH